MRAARRFAVLLLAGAPCACSDSSAFDITNGTRVEIVDLTVSDGPKVWKLGNLKPGAKTAFAGGLTGQDTGTISWTIGGKRYSADGCFYTVGGATHGSLTIAGDHLDYRCT